jgi:cysteine desulfurase/selenocysteine lyase
MTMNTPSHNGSNGHDVNKVRDTGNIIDVQLVQALANEFYAALPGVNTATSQFSQAEATGENIPTNHIPTNTVTEQITPASHVSSGQNTGVVPQSLSLPADLNLASLGDGGITGLTPALFQNFLSEPYSLAPNTIEHSSILEDGVLDKIADQLFAPLPPLFSEEEKQITSLSSEVKKETPLYFLSSSATVPHLGLDPHESFDVETVRRDFPILHQRVNGKPLIWFDNAATTQKPQAVIDALSHFYQRDNSNIHRGAHTLAARATNAYEEAREKVQRFLGAGSSSEIIFARGSTEAINLIAQTYGRKYIQAGDEIILSTLEHHANIVPWQLLAKEQGAVLKVIPVTDSGEIILEEYGRLLGPRTKLVAVGHVSNALGTILPIKEIIAMAHRQGVHVLIDGAQGIPHLAVNVQDLDCDFYAFSGHKLFAPTGIGAIYVKRQILEDLPPWQGGGSMIRHVTFEQTIYSEPPAKFEAGTPNIADAVGLGAAIDYLNHLGIANIEKYEQKLTCYALTFPGKCF